MLHQQGEACKHGETKHTRRDQFCHQASSGRHSVITTDEGFFAKDSWYLGATPDNLAVT